MSETTHAATPDVLAESKGPGLSASNWMIVFLVVVTGVHMWLHHRAHGTINVHHAFLEFFLVLNLMVNFWEIGLSVTLPKIQAEYEATKDVFAGRALARIMEIFNQNIPIAKVLSFREWTVIWSGYSLFDPGYTRKDSFGYNIDVGNGYSTIVPATLFGLGMTYDIVSPTILGLIGVAMFWQMFYGTVVYFFQFFNSGRHLPHTAKEIFLFVWISNGLWFVFPLWGIWVSYRFVVDQSFALVR